MGAMLIGMVTGLAAMTVIYVLIFIEKIIITAALFFIARRQGMQAVKWAVAGFFFDIWTVLVYVCVRMKMANRKCPSCGTKAGRDADFCINCGTAIEKISEGTLAKKFVKYILIAWAVFEILAIAYLIIVESL